MRQSEATKHEGTHLHVRARKTAAAKQQTASLQHLSHDSDERRSKQAAELASFGRALHKLAAIWQSYAEECMVEAQRLARQT